MKKALMTLAVQQAVGRSVLVASGLIWSSMASAATYNTSVDLNSTTLAAGDKVISSDVMGIHSQTSGGSALQLGSGAIEITINPALAAAAKVYGVNLANQTNNDLGKGSAITVSQTGRPTGSFDVTGIYLSTQSNLTASALNLNVSGQAVFNTGIQSGGNNTIMLSDNSKVTVTADGAQARGFYLTQNSQLYASSIQIIAKANNLAKGIEASSSVVNLGNGSSVTAENLTGPTNNTSAIRLQGSSTLTATNLELIGNKALGLYAGGTSTIDIGSDSSITSDGTGVMLQGTDVNFTANRLDIMTTANAAYGMDLNIGTHLVKLGQGSTIRTEGNSAFGIWMVGRDDSVLTADSLTIETKGAGSHALEVREGQAKIGSNSLFIAEKASAVVVSAASGVSASATISDSKLIAGGSYAASAQNEHATLNLNNVDIEIDRNSSIAYGLWAVNRGEINVNRLRLDAADGAHGIVASGQGMVNLTGHLDVNAHGDMAMLSDGANSTISGHGQMVIQGHLAAQNSGLIDIAMQGGSSLQGNANQLDDAIINIAMDNSLWQFDADSNINNLALSNSAYTTFASTDFTTLTVNNLSGAGLFDMKTDIVGQQGDLLKVAQSTAGDHQIHVQNNGSQQTDGTETLVIVETVDGQGLFALENDVELGGYTYGLRQTGNDWELYSKGILAPAADASVSFFQAGYLMDYAENQTLLQRMGDLRQSTEVGNVWVRAFYGNFDAFDSGKVGRFDMTYRGIQLGVDKGLSTEKGAFYYGLFGGLTDSDQTYHSGEGTLKSRSVGLYGTYIFNSGAYVDAVLKYQRHKNKFDLLDTQGDSVNGRGTSNGLSASIETGHRLFLSESDFGVFVEPQLQLTYGWRDRTNMKSSNGLNVKLDSYNSWLGRAGVFLGYEMNQLDKQPITFYFKNSWLHEFDGKTHYHVNSAKESISFKGGAWVSGVGVSAQFNDKHTLYLDMAKTTGKRFNQNQLNAGYRFSF